MENENNSNNSISNEGYNSNNNTTYTSNYNSNMQGYNTNNTKYNPNYNSNVKGYNLNSNQNINENPVNNSEKLKVKNRVLMRTITIIVLIVSIVGKFLSIGLLTYILTMTFILPLYFVAFTKAGLHLADIKNKDKKDYIYFAVLCISMLLWIFSFVDDLNAGGGDPNGPMKSMNETFRSIIFNFSLITNIIFLILSFNRYNKKNSELHKQENMENH